MSSRRLAATITCTAFILAGIYADPAHALDAYWHGVRSDVWSDGNLAGVSNWYSQPPPGGQARNVPDGTATFAPGAMRFNLRITQDTTIGRMLFTNDAPLYTFRIVRNRRLNLTGAGLVNRSSAAPKITILSNALIRLVGAARLVGAGANAAQITNNNGRLYFLDSTRGGDAIVLNTNEGTTAFVDSSSAERMKVTNTSGGSLEFLNNATGDKAHVINKAGGLLELASARGPDGDSQVPIGQVENDGEVALGTRTLRVARSFTQGSGGALMVTVTPARFGSIVVSSTAALDGTLTVGVSNNATAGTYKIIRTVGGRTGKFATLDYKGPDNLKARLAYSGKEVTLILENK